MVDQWAATIVTQSGQGDVLAYTYGRNQSEAFTVLGDHADAGS